jgi:polygalacturonase
MKQHVTDLDDIILIPGDLTDHTARIQTSVDACAAKGGGRVVFRPGRYVSGTVLLRDGVTLHLEKGAVLAGSPRIEDYFRKPRPPECEWIEAPAIEGGQPTALLFSENVERIGLTGEGVIDGTGEAFYRKLDATPDWAEARKPFGTWIPAFEMGVGAQSRPLALIFFIGCRDVRIETVRIQNSPRWTVHLLACTRIGIRGISLESPINCPNGDGIDLDACSDVVIEDCDIQTGDDAITVYNTNMWGMKRPSRNIAIRRCRLRATPHGFVMGDHRVGRYRERHVGSRGNRLLRRSSGDERHRAEHAPRGRH